VEGRNTVFKFVVGIAPRQGALTKGNLHGLKTFLGGLTLALAAQGFPDDASAQAPPEAAYVPGEVLIQFKPSVSSQGQAAVRDRIGVARVLEILDEASRTDGKGDLELGRLPPGFTVAQAIRELETDPQVEFAQPNYLYFPLETSDDPYYTSGLLWGMYGDTTTPANLYGSQAGEAWAAGQIGSRDVYVAVSDTGVMWFHEDLQANMGCKDPETGSFCDPVDGVDNDGNGKVDDIYGWDFAGEDNTTYDSRLDDHGTHVAGTLGAVGGNATGVVGVNWRVGIITAKFMGSGTGTTVDAIEAIDYVTDLKTRGVNLVAINASWGSTVDDPALEDAINRTCSANVLFIAAAGNNGTDNDEAPIYPASYPSECIIAVAAINSQGQLSTFSNYGATSVDLGAPGEAIYSTLPGFLNQSTYGALSGTSMATPHVTGAAALYKAYHPEASALEIKSAILDGTIPTPSLAGKTVTGGRLNVGSDSGF
jgi:subtilisin family serine protease